MKRSFITHTATITLSTILLAITVLAQSQASHQAGGELEQIQFLLGHVSIQTTEKYLGCKQRFQNAVNDDIGLEPSAPL